MTVLGLALQPVHGPDLMLQTKVWFPPARAMAACKAFRNSRHVDITLKQHGLADGANQAFMLDRLGDDPLAAASGQVVVGSEQRYRVVYRLVNSIYVLGITMAEEDETSLNVFHSTTMVNQAVSVLVTACKGVDVTPEKIFRKYTEVYLSLSYVLQDVSPSRLSVLLSAVHGDGTALLTPLQEDKLSARENRARGAARWAGVRATAVDQLATMEVLSSSNFELPEETLSAGDKCMPDFAPAPTQAKFDQQEKEKATPSFAPSFQAKKQQQQQAARADATGAMVVYNADVANDPFAASDSLLGQSDLAAAASAAGQGQGQGQGQAAAAKAESDTAAMLAELEAGLTSGPAVSSSDPFAGDDVAAAFGDELKETNIEEASDAKESGGGSGNDPWSSAFTGNALLGGDGDAWGGGLDAAEFGIETGGGGLGSQEEDALVGLADKGPVMGPIAAAMAASDVAGRQLEVALGLGGPQAAAPGAVTGVPPSLSPSSLPPSGPKRPTFRVVEEISAEFLGAALLRVRLQGTLLLALPKPMLDPGFGAEAVAVGGGGDAQSDAFGAPVKKEGADLPKEFSFRLDGSAAIKRAVQHSEAIHSLGKGYFHLRFPLPPSAFHSLQPPSHNGATAAAAPAAGDLLGDLDGLAGGAGAPGGGLSEDGGAAAGVPGGLPGSQPSEVVLLKYRLIPRFTPVPLRLRFVTQRGDESLSLMIQYAPNPYLQAPLVNVTFALSLAFSPASLRVSPEAELDPWTKELRWKVPFIDPQAPPQRLRAQIPIVPDDLVKSPGNEMTPEEKQAQEARRAKEMAAYRVRVHFQCAGVSLSGISVSEVKASGKPPFEIGTHSFTSAEYFSS